jgi:hypothetical protein
MLAPFVDLDPLSSAIAFFYHLVTRLFKLGLTPEVDGITKGRRFCGR